MTVYLLFVKEIIVKDCEIIYKFSKGLKVFKA